MTNAELISAIKGEIERMKVSFRNNSSFRTVRSDTAKEFADNLLSFIESLEKSLPVEELPEGLDEAAVQAAQVDMCDRQIMEDSNEHRMLYSRIFRRGFKAGAEWMAIQGGSFENSVFLFQGRPMLDGLVRDCVPALEKAEAKSGDKVVVQIRKK